MSRMSAAIVALVWLLLPGAAASTDAVVTATAVDAIGLTVSNLERSKAFFREVLSFTLDQE